MIKIIACRVDQSASVEEMDNGLKAFQEFVDGHIEMVGLEPGLSLVCNEEGKLMGLPPNRPIFGGMDVIAGDCFLVRVDENGECISVTDEDIEKYKHF